MQEETIVTPDVTVEEIITPEVEVVVTPEVVVETEDEPKVIVTPRGDGGTDTVYL